jgi:thiosulfate/3-mercaptopyruvate sulfurtransferase
MSDYANPDLLTTPEKLQAALESPAKPLVIDLRPPDAFAAGHIPGAVHLDLWGVSLIDTDPAPLKAFMWMIDHLFQLRGVDQSTPVVVYDEQSGMRAARAFWFLEYFGHPDVKVLDGGFGAWVHAGLPVTRDAAPATQSTWTGTPQERTLATWRDVKARLGNPNVVIVDTRSIEEHNGTLVRAKRGGRIPGAVHVEWTRNLAADGRFKPADELRAIYQAAGVTPDKEVVTYCQGGYRAAHGYLALRLLGYPRVRNYTGSWKEWGDRTELPVEN